DYLDYDKRVPVDVAKLLFEAAEAGDAVAIEILQRQGVELGKAAAAVARRLGMGGDTFDVVLTGSLVTRGDRGAWIRGALEPVVREAAPGARIVTLTVDPVFGAVWAAMEEDGLTIGADVYERM